jgi:hypothetical protein
LQASRRGNTWRNWSAVRKVLGEHLRLLRLCGHSLFHPCLPLNVFLWRMLCGGCLLSGSVGNVVIRETGLELRLVLSCELGHLVGVRIRAENKERPGYLGLCGSRPPSSWRRGSHRAAGADLSEACPAHSS